MSTYVSGYVTVGIVDKMHVPIDGVDMLLENDLAGGQVEVCLMLCEKPVVPYETYNVTCEVSDLYPEGVVTKPIARRAKMFLGMIQ